MKKILIVDDEPNIVMSLEYTLKKQGYEVYIARDGAEALEIMQQSVPDLVLLDIMMPHIDGYETLKKIKEDPAFAKAKTIFLSAKNKKSDIEKGFALGADAYFTKPFSIKKLITKVENLIN